MSWDLEIFAFWKGSPGEGFLRTFAVRELHPVGQVAAMAVNPQNTLKGEEIKGKTFGEEMR